MTSNRRTFAIFGALLALAIVTPAQSQSRDEISEPRKISSPSRLKDGEGALQLSVRTQKQFIETAIFYLAQVDEAGRDTGTILRFERGAGVPIMGSNMIDEKQQVYRVPAGRYRPIAYTVACDQMPFAPGVYCRKGFASYPAGRLDISDAFIEVREGALTLGGDFIVEYGGAIPAAGTSIFDIEDSPADWSLRWRPARETASRFEQLPLIEASSPPDMRSRIECNQRPDGVTLYIPFTC